MAPLLDACKYSLADEGLGSWRWTHLYLDKRVGVKSSNRFKDETNEKIKDREMDGKRKYNHIYNIYLSDS